MQHVLGFDQIILASPVYWYGVSAPMKIFLDRISDFLDVPEMLAQGRRLRGKRGFVVCTSVYDEVASPFINALKQTFEYLGMEYGGVVHANCRSGYQAVLYEADISGFVGLVNDGSWRSQSALNLRFASQQFFIGRPIISVLPCRWRHICYVWLLAVVANVLVSAYVCMSAG